MCVCVCVCVGQWKQCAFFPSFFLFVLCFVAFFPLYLIVDVYLIVIFNQKIAKSTSWLLVGKLSPGNVLICLLHLTQAPLWKALLFGRAWPPLLWESISDAGENKAFAHIPVDLVGTLTEEIQQQMLI